MFPANLPFETIFAQFFRFIDSVGFLAVTKQQRKLEIASIVRVMDTSWPVPFRLVSPDALVTSFSPVSSFPPLVALFFPVVFLISLLAYDQDSRGRILLTRKNFNKRITNVPYATGTVNKNARFAATCIWNLSDKSTSIVVQLSIFPCFIFDLI